MAALLGHAGERHAPPDGHLLRYRNGRRITYRRYDHLWERLGRSLPWVRAQQISMHWIRHTTPDLGRRARNFGFAVAEAYAGHEDNGRGARSMGAMATYVRAACPRWRPPSPPSPENPTRWPPKTPAQAPPANTGIDPSPPCSQYRTRRPAPASFPAATMVLSA